MASPIITLTTDWSAQDFYVGKVKGRLFSSIPDARVVDITHQVPPTDKAVAAYIVKNACLDFPEGTIHIVDVNAARAADSAVAIEANGQFFLMVDNGMPALIFGDRFSQAVALDNHPLPPVGIFLSYDLFCPVAARLAAGTPLQELGTPYPALRPAAVNGYVNDDKSLIAYITYIDAYGNTYLGISYKEFEQIRAGRSFRLKVREYDLDQIVAPNGATGKTSPDVVLQLTVSPTGDLMLNTTQPSENTSRLFGLRKMQMLRFVFS